jgi:hypothetical protein
MRILLSTILLLALGASAMAEPMQCNVGPVAKDLGGAKWNVLSCSDGRSLVFVTAKGNPAMPFYFMVQRDEETAKIVGEGNGSKEYSAIAYEEIKRMTAVELDELVQATKDVSQQE